MARKGLNIYKRKDGRWEARYIKSRNTQGEPRYGYLYATSYHEVRNNLQRVIQAMNTYDAEKVPATNCKFMGFSVIWLENSSTSLKESTYIRYRTLLNCYLMPSFQQLEISEITSERVCTFCKNLEKHEKKDGTGLSPKTISDILSVLRRILHAFTIFRLARTAGVNLPGKTKYLQQVYTIYNGGSRRAALPLKF